MIDFHCVCKNILYLASGLERFTPEEMCVVYVLVRSAIFIMPISCEAKFLIFCHIDDGCTVIAWQLCSL
jgi:hypothetical protein